MTYKEVVLAIYPSAHVRCDRTKKTIWRARTKDDSPALVPRVAISAEHYSEDAAWRDAALRLDERRFA